MQVKTFPELTSSSSNKALSFILALCAISLLYPYFVWSDVRLFEKITYAIGILTILIIIFNRNNYTIHNVPLIILFFAFAIFSMLAGTEIKKITYVPLLALLFISLKPEDQHTTFNYFIDFLSVIFFIGIISYILQKVGLNIQIGEAHAPNEMKGVYRVYFGHAEETGLPIYRFSSIFDEAGVVGTVSGLTLTSVNFSLKDKRFLIILLAGLISFSLAFYLFLIINMLFSLNLKKAVSVIMVVAAIYVLANDKVYYLIGNRLTFKEGRWTGDNRSNNTFDTYYNNFLNSGGSEVILGKGSGFVNSLKVSDEVSSYKLFVVDFGIGGIVLIILFYTISTWSIANNRFGWLLCLVFLASAFQRPDLISYPVILMFIGGLRQIQFAEEDKQNDYEFLSQ